MSLSARDDLLEPTLMGTGRQIQPIYSLHTLFLVSVLAGPMPSALLTAVNAYRLGRLWKDSWLVALGLSASVVLLWWQVTLGGNEWLRSMIGRTGPRVAGQIVGFGYFGLSFLLHRPFYRNMEFAGITPPKGWVFALFAVLLSVALMSGLAGLFNA